MPQAPLTIGFAGPPGAGKSALIAALLSRRSDAVAVSADDFPAPHAMPFDALKRWIAAGADFASLEVEAFAHAVAGLRAGQPYCGRRVPPHGMLLVEAPLGRAHPGTAPLIDRLVWIDTPLDVAFVRNLIAWRAEPGGPPAAWIDDYLAHYLGAVRHVLVAQRDAVMPSADLVLDGVADIQSLAAQVLEWLER